MKHLLRFGLLAIVLAVPALMAAAAPAKPAAAPASIVGVCDSEKIDKEFKGFDAAQSLWTAFQEERVGSFDELVAGQYLTPKEFDELLIFTQQKVKTDQKRYDELTANAKKASDEYQALVKKVKDNLTEDEKKQLDQLEASAQYTPDAEAQQKALIDKGKAKLSDADKARLTEMEDNHEQVIAVLTKHRDDLRKQLNDEGARLIQALKDQTTAAIAKVAADSKLAIVLSKNVAAGQEETQQLVLWGGTDITDAVIKYLNDNFKPESLAPKK